MRPNFMLLDAPPLHVLRFRICVDNSELCSTVSRQSGTSENLRESRMSKLTWVLSAVLSVALLGCKPKEGAAVEGVNKAGLRATLVADPKELFVNMMPGGAADKPQPKEVTLTLTIENTSREDYHGVSKRLPVVRYAVLDGRFRICYTKDEAGAEVITNIDIPAGKSWSDPKPFKCHLDDARKYKDKT